MSAWPPSLPRGICQWMIRGRAQALAHAQHLPGLTMAKATLTHTRPEGESGSGAGAGAETQLLGIEVSVVSPA